MGFISFRFRFSSLKRVKDFVDLSKERKYQMAHFVPLLVGMLQARHFVLLIPLHKKEIRLISTSRQVTRETAEKFAEGVYIPS